MTVTRKGKIGGLPHSIREQLNRRLRDGQLAPQILPWLNALPETAAYLAARWNGDPVTAQNLSEWRAGGYAEWLGRQEKAERLKELSEYALKLAGDGTSPTDAAAAIAGGQMLEILEQLDTSATLDLLKDKPSTHIEMIFALAQLQKEGTRRAALELATVKAQRETAALFIKWFEDRRAKQILESGDAQPVKMEKLVKLMFGDRPELAPVNV